MKTIAKYVLTIFMVVAAVVLMWWGVLYAMLDPLR